MPQEHAVADEIAGILWSVHGEHLRSILIGLIRRLVDQIADTVNEVYTDGIAEPLAIGSARGGYIPDIPLRYYWNCGRAALAVIVEPPCCRTIAFNQRFVAHFGGERCVDLALIQRYHLALPYVVFVFTQDADGDRDLYVFYRTRPWERLDNQLLVANLPNIFETNQTACLGGYESDATDPLAAAAGMITRWWLGAHNTDLVQNFEKVGSLQPTLATLSRWQQCSRANPRFILSDYPLVVTDLTVEKILGNQHRYAIKSARSWITNECARLATDLDHQQIVDDVLSTLTGALRQRPQLNAETLRAVHNRLARMTEGS